MSPGIPTHTRSLIHSQVATQNSPHKYSRPTRHLHSRRKTRRASVALGTPRSTHTHSNLCALLLRHLLLRWGVLRRRHNLRAGLLESLAPRLADAPQADHGDNQDEPTASA